MNLKIKKDRKRRRGNFWLEIFFFCFSFCIVHNVIVVVVESDEHQSKILKLLVCERDKDLTTLIRIRKNL